MLLICFHMKMLKPRTEWMLDFQGMIILISNQIWWTAEVENVFKKISDGHKRAMKDVSKYKFPFKTQIKKKKKFSHYHAVSSTT